MLYKQITTASDNTAVGKDALEANTTGNIMLPLVIMPLDANTTSLEWFIQQWVMSALGTQY